MDGVRSQLKNHTSLAGDMPAPTGVEELLRQLLDHLAETPDQYNLHSENGSNQETVLDVDVDGVRYTLTRYYPPSPQSGINLSPREKEIVRLVAKGFPNKAIGAILEISPWTVATHLRRAFAKLGAGSRAEIVARALEEGLLANNGDG